jgi:predicted Zn-dependent protease
MRESAPPVTDFPFMADPIEDLVQRWKKNPSPGQTIALCDALRISPRGPLVQQVGEQAMQQHAGDPSVLVSVARMYLEARRLTDAQVVLVAAGKTAPRDGAVYRWLGETLLRRGDADRAEKVLEHAIGLGSDGDTRAWLDRARALRPMQAKAGPSAVAAEVAHAGESQQRSRLIPADEAENDTTTAVQVRASDVIDGVASALERTEKSVTMVVDELDVELVDGQPTGPVAPAKIQAHIAGLGGAPLPGVQAMPAAEAFARPAPGRAMTPPWSRPGALPGQDRPVVPHPRDVLDALALAGVFEPPARRPTTGAAWDRPERGPKRRGTVTLVVAMVAFLGGSVGTYFFYKDKRAGQHQQADALLATVDNQLHTATPADLTDAEGELAQAFALESRNQRAALDWIRERALVGLVRGGADVAFEDAMARAKEVGVPEEQYAFARVASFLFQGDTAGAAAVLPRWDGPAASDAWYQLVAGATLERAGDSRAKARYQAAASLDPELVVARIAQARATAIEGDAQEGMRLARALRAAMPQRAEPVALVAIAWGRDPLREDTPAPPEVDELPKREAELPLSLKFAPHAITALQAIDKHQTADARSEIQKGLAMAESPGVAVWLGTIALSLDDEALGRKAAVSALQFSAVYEPARALAARVALLGGRLDEALKATEDLDPSSPDVAVVRAASAYERVDADGVDRALDAVPPDVRKQPFLAALSLAQGALSGRLQPDGAKLLAISADDAPWSDLLAMDVALDEGELATADKIAASWGRDTDASSLRALRLARLARYEGRLDAAEPLSQASLYGTVTPRVLWERVYFLVARGRGGEVGPLLAHYPLVLGPLATWLSAYAAAAGGSVDAARGKTASLDPPPASAPLETRIVVAAAMGALKDKRRGVDYVRELLATGSGHPDLAAAAAALGMHTAPRAGRRR